jgi:hypothetical protein
MLFEFFICIEALITCFKTLLKSVLSHLEDPPDLTI